MLMFASLVGKNICLVLIITNLLSHRLENTFDGLCMKDRHVYERMMTTRSRLLAGKTVSSAQKCYRKTNKKEKRSNERNTQRCDMLIRRRNQMRIRSVVCLMSVKNSLSLYEMMRRGAADASLCCCCSFERKA